jgi:PadR family transcriptional regulator AphA
VPRDANKTALSPAEWASLGLLAEQPAHGFAVARAFAPEGEVGRVWSCSRPLVYRALAVLVERGLVEERGSQPSEAGPQRTMLGVTRAGRRELERWLAEPAEHVRDIRSALMLKLLFLSRRGADPSELLERQREVLASLVEGLEAAWGDAEDFDRVLYLWRLESARASLRFVSGAARGASPSP